MCKIHLDLIQSRSKEFQGPVSPNLNPESHEFQIWILNPCMFEKMNLRKVVWNLNPRNMKNFESGILSNLKFESRILPFWNLNLESAVRLKFESRIHGYPLTVTSYRALVLIEGTQKNRQGIFDPPITGDVDSMTPSIRWGVKTMNPPPPIRGGVESMTPSHLLVASFNICPVSEYMSRSASKTCKNFAKLAKWNFGKLESDTVVIQQRNNWQNWSRKLHTFYPFFFTFYQRGCNQQNTQEQCKTCPHLSTSHVCSVNRCPTTPQWEKYPK